jgi:hypothetical protein
VRNPHAHFVFLSVVESLPRDAPDHIVTAFRRPLTPLGRRC